MHAKKTQYHLKTVNVTPVPPPLKWDKWALPLKKKHLKPVFAKPLSYNLHVSHFLVRHNEEQVLIRSLV